MTAYWILDEHGRPFTGRYADIPRGGAGRTDTPPPIEESQRKIEEGLRRMGYGPLTEAASPETTEFVERPSWASAPRPKPKPSTPSSGSRTVELREPGNAEGSLRDALRRLGVNASAADSAAGGHDS